jgi:hypothetical protein
MKMGFLRLIESMTSSCCEGEGGNKGILKGSDNFGIYKNNQKFINYFYLSQ